MTSSSQSKFPHFLYGTAWKEDRTASLTELAIRTGFRGIDTANQRKHYFEEGVGQALINVYREGLAKRDNLFLQTKFTYQRGQDHRLPYDPNAPLATQVAQSLAASLQHLGTDYVDSFVLHGPSSSHDWTDDDAESWEAMRRERDAGRTRFLGVSNVALAHLEQMERNGTELPSFVQNRCYARLGWDRGVRSFCAKHQLTYQGFSLLTANQDVVNHHAIGELARELDATPAQLIFSFAKTVGILPLTGTSKVEHMREDLSSLDLALPDQLVSAIESAAG